MNEKDYIDSVNGKPWVNRSTGPDSFDCYGLMIDYFKRVKNITLPLIDGYKDNESIRKIGQAGEVFWNECDIKDAESFACYDSCGAMLHVGIVTSYGYLHAFGKADTGQVYLHDTRRFNAAVKLGLPQLAQVKYFKWQ